METISQKLRFVFVITATMLLSACLTDESVSGDSSSSIDGLSIAVTSPEGVSSLQTPDIVINITGTVSSNAGIDAVSWINDRGGKGIASGTEKWTTGNIVLQLGINNITVAAADIDGKTVSYTVSVERENTTAAGSDDADRTPVVMYSYNSNLSSAAPVDGATINPQLVYIFVVPGSDWQDRGIADIKIHCCKGVAGPGQGEDYSPLVTVKNSPWAQMYDMSSFAADGTRRAKIWAKFNDGTLSENFRFDFTVASPLVGANRAPTISGSPTAIATVGNQYNFRPTATDLDGDTLLFTIKNKPAWATLSKTTGRLHGTPGNNDVGTYASIGISVSDGSTTANLPTFSIKVEASANGSATLNWSIPTERTDNSALGNKLAGFNIYYGQTSGDYGNIAKISNPGLSTYMIENLSSGAWFFVVTALDGDGIESNPSGEGSKTF
jgi:hypothetical protein